MVIDFIRNEVIEMPNIPVVDCCGCTACYNICPKSAIKMIANDEGFLYPNIEKKLCIGCNKCERVCRL